MHYETNTRNLIANMNPRLHAKEYVFCSIDPILPTADLGFEPIGWFRESEGVSIILDRGSADSAGLSYGIVLSMISLEVFSSLRAVGFLASITSKLALAGVSANPISAYHHDHIFVPRDEASRALTILRDMMDE